MSGESGGSKADTLVKVVLFVFISLLSFSVGTFVGKQVSDSDHRRMALEGEYGASRSVASNEEHEGKDEHGEASSKVTEKDVEALTEEFVNREKDRQPASEEEDKAEEHGDHHAAKAEKGEKAEAAVDKAGGYKSYPRNKAVAHAEGAEKEATEAVEKEKDKHAAKPVKVAKGAPPKADGVEKAAEKVSEGAAPTDGAAEPKKEAPGLPSVASSAVGKYTVQVGSYLDEKEAKTRAADLKGQGWNAFYLPANVKGKTWYRVLVGLFNDQERAKQFRAQFMKEANTQAAIVQKIVQ